MRFLPLAATLLLAACSTGFSAQDLPKLAHGEVRWYRIDKLDAEGGTVQTSLLAVQQQDGNETRWVQTDAFGAPQARLVASEKGWRRDGFVMPNREAQQLFTAMFPFINHNSKQPEKISSGRSLWQITPIEQP